jgi:hypothetical protein
MNAFSLLLAIGTFDPQSFADTMRATIAPIFLLIVGVVALSFLMRRQLSQFIQFFALTVLIGVLFYVPNVVESFSKWFASLLGM